GSLADAVGLEHLSFGLEPANLLLQLVADLADRPLDRRLRGHVLRRREDRDRVVAREHFAGERIEVRYLLDLVAEERHAVRRLRVRGLDLDDVSLDAESPPSKQRVVADVLDVDQLAEHEITILLLARVDEDDPLLVLLGGSETVDARDGGDDDDVAAREQRRRRRVPEAVDVVVARRVLLDVQVRLRDVRLGLVVVVVRDEVLDRVGGEEFAELVAELGGERLVVSDHERRPAHLLDRPGHRRGLAGPRRADERLEPLAAEEALGQLSDRPWLVSGGAVHVRGFQSAHARQGIRMVAAHEARRTPPYGAYAAIVAAFAGALATGGALARLLGRDPREETALDLAVLSAATFKAARTISRD